MAKRQIIALRPNVNVRRGPNTLSGVLGEIHVGDQLEIVGDLIFSTGSTMGECWAQVIWPRDVNVNAYVCVALTNGSLLCKVASEPAQVDQETYKQAWNDALDAVHAALVKLRV